MAGNKTQPTGVAPADFLATVPDETRRADAGTLIAMMERLSGERAYMWGPTIIGFGSYTYKCGKRDESAPRLGFAPRGRETVVYLMADYDKRDAQLARLGKHKMSKCCLYIRKLADVDLDVLEEMVAGDLKVMDRKYPREA